MGMHPRWIMADIPTANTQRTTDRQFLFKPDPFTRNAIGASAARALQKFPVKIYWLEFNINHEQNGIAPLSESNEHLNNVISFRKHFHQLLAFEINTHLGREGAVFSTPARSVPCLDDQSLEQQFFYALTNPAKDGLVDRVSHWKGFSSYPSLAKGVEETFYYYDRTAWHRCGKKKPLEAFLHRIGLEYTPLPSLRNLSPHQRRMYIRREVRRLEQDFRERRNAEHRSAMSKCKLDKTNHRDRPKTKKERTRKPLCHCACPVRAWLYRQELRDFLNAYFAASSHYRMGFYNTPFPEGSVKPPLIEIAA